MRTKFNLSGKVLVLISNDHLFDFAKTELEKIGFQIEELLYMVPHCRFVILDCLYLQSGIANYLNEKGVQKPIYLMLTRMQLHSENIQSKGRFHDILVIPDRSEGESRHIISALRGQIDFQNIFEEYQYLSPFEEKKKSEAYGRLFSKVA